MFKLTKPIVDIAIVCSDFESSLHFYRDLLGLETVLDISIPAETANGAELAPREFRQVRLKAGETLIKLMEIDSPPPARSHEFQTGIRWLTFLIDDVPGTKAALQENGVEFLSDPVPAPDAKFIVCAKAPDGVLIEFVQVD
jgi:glyoxylase I family protein